MVKNSFTLFETILSVFLLSIILVGFSKNINYDNFDSEYMTLNKLENSFNTNNFSSDFKTMKKDINIIKNESVHEKISINEISYEDESIKIFKYKF